MTLVGLRVSHTAHCRKDVHLPSWQQLLPGCASYGASLSALHHLLNVSLGVSHNRNITVNPNRCHAPFR